MEIEVSERITHDKHRTYNATQKGRARNERRNRTLQRVSEARYLAKPFVAWDGEGGNETDGSHTYFTLANSDGTRIQSRQGLATKDIFDMCLASRKDVTNIIYGGNYDINMWLRDLDRTTLTALYKTSRARWFGYRLEWRPGKSFRISLGDSTFLLYDVLPFFQTTFVKACDEYLGKDWPYRDEIIREKARRGQFDWTEIEKINDYNAAELSTLVTLANELKTRLHRVEIRVQRWDGPGAIASSLYKKYGTKSYLAQTPNEVAKAGRHAYAGGRFEIIRKGHSVAGAWQYDIRSAYPSAIRYLPCLQHGQWRHRHNPTSVMGFGVYRCEVIKPSTQSVTQPQPLWMRNKNGTVYFSEYSHGWYWSPEAQLANELGGVTIHEGWEWHQECNHQPFWFVEGLYNKRAALKKAGDGAHVGLKLGLNSLYGKLAQQIGWDPGPPLKIPPYHSLEWAGWITSHCRTQVYKAAMQSPDDIIAFETDAVFSRSPLSLAIGDKLGEWEATEYSSLTYLKSGMYFGTKIDGTEIEKTRGINKGSITREQMIRAIEEEWDYIPAEQTRFIGLGQALNQDFSLWRKWITSPREIQVALNGKRIDILDRRDNYAIRNDGWKETQEGFHSTTFSHPYEVAWIPETHIANPLGDNIARVREMDCWEEE